MQSFAFDFDPHGDNSLVATADKTPASRRLTNSNKSKPSATAIIPDEPEASGNSLILYFTIKVEQYTSNQLIIVIDLHS